MRVQLAYGTDGLTVDLPDGRTTVITPAHPPVVGDERAALREALRHPEAGPPLRDRVRPGQTVAISACDGTRPQPRRVMVEAILEEFDGVVSHDDLVILVATGTHRGNTDAELRQMFGDWIVDNLRIVNHDARDDGALRFVGTFGRDVPVWLNREWVDADVRITTGFVEPHFFAGFSGGPKLVAPGLAGLETVLTLHDAQRIGDPRATWGVIEGNPVHDDVRAIAAGTGVHFALDVILNREQRIVAAFGGDLLAMHAAATAAARTIAMRPVREPFDVVLTTNAGFPLDQNLYQSVKGMSAAATVVRPGGTIICAAECRDGFPDHGSYREVLTSQPSPAALLREIQSRPRAVPDQWQVQIQARIQTAARVVMHTSYLSDAQLAEAHLEQTADIADCVARHGPHATVCVLPEGPQTIPYLQA
ncbi:nickel-dependent lactate racemase [Rugosimonospora acidiphila]|uniref:Nickel-dependent lactate racemase n=1 Tax=Rugosimonospora acidiphila TaxID=556531 RepID=A0ABP9S396_9ACTN